jgi:hypothetical protein
VSVETRVYSTTKRAIAIVGFAVLLAVLLIGLRKLSSRDLDTRVQTPLISTTTAAYIAPVVQLRISDAHLEAAWSAALAQALEGRTEVPVQNGRVDVLSDVYAIEVDRLDKWHEGIGQAAHYGLATGKIACLALIVESDRWPLNEVTIAKLRTIERVALAKGVKILLLRRVQPDGV